MRVAPLAHVFAHNHRLSRHHASTVASRASNLGAEAQTDDFTRFGAVERIGRRKKRARERAFDACVSHGDGVLITTYEHMRLFRDRICAVRWGYAVLDEGHKIRNPGDDVTIVAKQLQTCIESS